jgi:hypothetical protein
LAVAAEVLRETTRGRMEEILAAAKAVDCGRPTPAEVAERERKAAEKLALNRAEWRRTNALFVVFGYSGCCVDDHSEEPLSWWSTEAEAQAEVERLDRTDRRHDDYGWVAIPKGGLDASS